MSKILISVPVLEYTGMRSSGPVLPAGTHECRISDVVLTDDSVNNPWSPDSETKDRPWDVSVPNIAVKYACQAGGITDRLHPVGFRRFQDLTEAEKASGQFSEDLETGYALTPYLDSNGKKVGIPTGELKPDGTPKLRTALMRVVDPENTTKARRIISDLLANCGIPAASLSLEQVASALKSYSGTLSVTVVEEEYGGKTRSKVKSVKATGTPVPVAATTEEEDEF